MTQFDEDIGNLVEQMLVGGTLNPKPQLSEEDQLHKSMVVTEEMVASFIPASAAKPLPTRLKAVVKKEVLVEEKEAETKTMQELIVEFKKCVFQAKAIINEMTTVGALGVNMAPPAKKKVVKKKEVVKKKRVKVAESTDDICNQIIEQMRA